MISDRHEFTCSKKDAALRNEDRVWLWMRVLVWSVARGQLNKTKTIHHVKKNAFAFLVWFGNTCAKGCDKNVMLCK